MGELRAQPNDVIYLLTQIAALVTEEARRRELDLKTEQSIQYLERKLGICVDKWTRNKDTGIKNDKVSIAQNEVNKAKGLMEENLKKMVENMDAVSDLEAGSNNLKDTAKEFQTNAKNVESEAKKQRNRIYIYSGVAVAGVATYVFAQCYSTF